MLNSNVNNILKNFLDKRALQTFNSWTEIDFSLNFTMYSVSTSKQESFAPINTADPQWWNCIQFGGLARLTIIAVQSYIGLPGYGKIYFRVRHDNSWSPWFINSPTFTLSGTTLNISL